MRLSRHNLMQLLRRTGVITAWIALIICIVIGGVYAFKGYVGFDEGFNLQMPGRRDVKFKISECKLENVGKMFKMSAFFQARMLSHYLCMGL